MNRSLSAFLVCFFGCLFLQPATAQVASDHSLPLKAVRQADRIPASPNLAQRTALIGHVPDWATPANLSASTVDTSQPVQLVLLLRRSAAAQSAFTQLLEDQQKPGSPLYHRGFAPAQVGALFGPTDHDIQAVENWAQSEGFTVESIAPSKTTIRLGGTLATVESAFHIGFGMYKFGEDTLRAPDAEPQVPVALLPVITSIGGLIEERAEPLNRPYSVETASRPRDTALAAQPHFTGNNGGFFVTPADFATIYDLNPILATNTGATVGGGPQHVAIIADSDADPLDIQDFATSIGSNSYAFTPFYPDTTDPGYGKGQGEATLDLERVLGTAPGVKADLVVGAGTTPIYDAAYYAVNTLKDPIITMSFGSCESELAASGVNMWNDLWSTAQANLTSVFVSAGDSGAAACESHGVAAPATQFRNINGYCSSPNVTCVGGTEFNDTANPSQYWGSTNDNNPATHGSALSYIPEGAWNDPTRMVNGATTYVVSSGSGGVSQFNPKPSWQTGTGVPADGFRDVPDIAFLASPIHDPYYYCFQRDCNVTPFEAFGDGGTSAASPSMAGIAALLNTAAGIQQGNLNPLIYRLANSPVAGSIFHDVTLASSGVANCDISIPSMCNNSLPATNALTGPGSLEGYVIGTGYDLATGWGSLDVANFIKAAIPVGTTLALSTNGSDISTAQSIIVTATLTSAGDSFAPPGGSVQFEINGVATGTPVALASNATTAGTLTFSAPGTYAVTAVYSGDGFYSMSTSSTITVVVTAQAPSFALAASTPSLSFTSGATTGNTETLELTSTSGYAGNVALSCSVSKGAAAFQPSCSVNPAAATLAANGTTMVTVTVASTSAEAFLRKPFQRDGSRRVLEAGLFFGGLSFLALPFVRMRRWRVNLFVLGLVALAGIAGMAGCSGSSTPTQSSAGTYTVTVTGSGTGAGALSASSASTTFSVNIQ